MSSPDESEDRDSQQSPHFKAFEAQLAALRPREDRLDRERLMFLAGQASVGSGGVLRTRRPRHWTRPALVGALVGAAAAAAVMVVVRPAPTSEIAARPTPPEREASVVAANWPSTTPLPFDLALPRDPSAGRLLTAAMSLRRPPGLSFAAEAHPAADETPTTDSPALRPGLTPRSLQEVLGVTPARAFSS